MKSFRFISQSDHFNKIAAQKTILTNKGSKYKY